MSKFDGRNDQLPRLEREYYRGQSYVHWTLTIQDRRTGWLIPTFYYKFRELLTHATFRYSITCPIFCLMPDHMHLLWIGIDDRTDQLIPGYPELELWQDDYWPRFWRTYSFLTAL